VLSAAEALAADPSFTKSGEGDLTLSSIDSASGLYIMDSEPAVPIPPGGVVLLKDGADIVASFRVYESVRSPVPKIFRAKLYKKYGGFAKLQAGKNYSATFYRVKLADSPTSSPTASSSPSSSESLLGNPNFSNRKRKPIGVDLYAGGADPVLGLLGFGLSYNLTDFLKITAAYGIYPTVVMTFSSISGGIRFFVPGWNLSPTFGLAYNYITLDATVLSDSLGQTFGLNVYQSGAQSIGVLSFPFGVDWQLDRGFHIALETSLTKGSGGTGIVSGSIVLGWAFNFTKSQANDASKKNKLPSRN
jgi:hypothetical protein